MAAHTPLDFYFTIVSFHEQILGWNAYIHRAARISGVVRGYAMLRNTLHDFAAARIAQFDQAAAEQFESLKQQRIRIGTMDPRIASIALARGYTVLSRNLVDFQRVPGLPVEDWASP
jgi:tRNA(fMet)-specific endonuclease VapC